MAQALITRRGGSGGVEDGTLIPYGAGQLPVNDAGIWLRSAGLSSGATLSGVLADADALSALMNSANAVNYMLRSTEIQTAVLGSAAALAALDASSPIVSPVMTSDTAPTGYVANANYDPTNAYKATSASSSVEWSSYQYQTVTTDWVTLEIPSSLFVYRVKAYFRCNNSGTRLCKIQASADGSAWTDVTSDESVTSGGEYISGAIPGMWKHFRFIGVANTTASGWYPKLAIYGVEIYGKAMEV